MRFVLTILLVVFAASASAQNADDDRSFITGLIEDTISNEDMEVRLTNFEGALSSQATADSITIADADGIWLQLDGLTIEWNRSALLSGRVEVDVLSAERIELIRMPLADDSVDLPSAEATPFTLPDLPVSIEILDVSADEIVLTEALLGEPVTAQFEGALSLIDGTAAARILLERTDSKTGRFDVDASFDDATRQLAVFLLAEEGENGIAARMIDLPDRPAVRLEVSGDAPLDDFIGQIALATEGTDRISGTVALSRPSGTVDQAFAVDLSGDLRPMLPSQYEDFFGANTVLQVEGTSFGVGGLRLSNLTIAAEQLVLRGSATLDAQGWPEAIDLRGQLGSGGTDRVLLPISGASTEVSGMSLNVTYDAANDAAWTGAFDITSLVREGVSFDALALSGGGTITPGAGGSEGQFTADLNYAARGVGLGDPAMAEAIGDDIIGTINIARREGEPLLLRDFTLEGAGLAAQGNAQIAGPDERFQTSAAFTVDAADFTRFAALTGLDLSGAGFVRIRGEAQPFDGIFDLFLNARTNDLALGIDQVDPILAGETVLSFQVERDTEGTRLERVRLANAEVIAQGSGEITGATARADFTAELGNLGLISPSLSGPANLSADLSTDPQGVVTLDTVIAAPLAQADLRGVATPAVAGYDVTGTGTFDIQDLSAYADLAGQPISGAGLVRLQGDVQTDSGFFDVALTARTTDLALGIAQVDPILAGDTVLSFQAERDGESTRIERVRIASPEVIAQGRGEIRGASASAEFNAELGNLGILTPSLSGPANLWADLSTDEQGIVTLDTTIEAPRARAVMQGTATPEDGGYLVRGAGDIAIEDLSAYGDLVGQRLGGGVSVELDGSYATTTGVLDADVIAQTRDIQAGSTVVDRILAGLGRVSVDVGLSEAGRLRLDAIDLVFPNLTATGAVASSGNDTTANLSVRLRDIALLVSDFSGPVVADVTARQDAAGWQVSGDATGPVQTAAQVNGRVSNDGQLDLSVSGSAPLALANLYIAPRQVSGSASFDLAVQGPPALNSVRGPVRISNAQLSAPNLQQSLENIGGTIQMAGGTARLDISGANPSGGSVTLSGPVDLSAPFNAGLTIALADYVLSDPNLYRTTAQGRVSVAGPLTGGATISGAINLGEVDVQVPSTGVSALGSLPAVTHLGTPTPVRRTLDRADVDVAPSTGTNTSSGAAFPLDLTISAPSRIFIRGRGLDAELGGQLRLTGSTANIIPIGRFDLVRGRLSILGQRFELDEGYAQLQGDFSPFLRLVATTEASSGTIVSIIVEGPADDIEVRFESTPELPQDEVLAQLLFGRDLSSISPLQAVQLASAVATLSGGGGGVIDNLRQGLDLDDLDLITDEDGNAAVRAGKYISDNVYTDVTVGSDGTSEINLNIDIDRNFTARGSVASDGETSVGIFFERDY